MYLSRRVDAIASKPATKGYGQGNCGIYTTLPPSRVCNNRSPLSGWLVMPGTLIGRMWLGGEAAVKKMRVKQGLPDTRNGDCL